MRLPSPEVQHLPLSELLLGWVKGRVLEVPALRLLGARLLGVACGHTKERLLCGEAGQKGFIIVVNIWQILAVA